MCNAAPTQILSTQAVCIGITVADSTGENGNLTHQHVTRRISADEIVDGTSFNLTETSCMRSSTEVSYTLTIKAVQLMSRV